MEISSIANGKIGTKTLQGSAVTVVVEMFRDLLERAERGEIRAAGVAMVLEKGVISYDYNFAYASQQFSDLYVASDYLKQRLYTHMTEE